MNGSPNIARTGALIGDLARASMLSALMSGKALTASELAREAGVTVQTASSHLRKLEDGGLLQMRKQGRHKYFTLASTEVAQVLEGMMGLVAGNDIHLKSNIGPRDTQLKKARVCYNHLAGDMGIRLYDSMIKRRLLVNKSDELILSRTGNKFVSEFGIDLEPLRSARAPLCRECLDWSERRSHLAGSVGRALLSRMEDLGWVKRVDGTRIIRFTRKGEAGFDTLFN